MNFKIFKKILLLTLLSLSSLNCTTTAVKELVNNYIDSDIQYYNYNDLDIKFTDHGSGETILFIHGLGSSSFTWRHLYKYYSLEYRVISIDLKGFGNSSKPINKDYLISDQANLVQQFINDLELKDITIIGNSFGGAVALSTYTNADFYTKRKITKLILLDPAAYKQEKLPGYVALLQTPFLNKIALIFGPKNLIANIILKQIFYDDSLITNEMITTYGNFLKGPKSHNALIQTAKSVSSDETIKLSSSYKNIRIPVLIIWGEDDNVIKKQMGEQLNSDIPKSELVILENCGHVPQEESPDLTINIINDFFENLY